MRVRLKRGWSKTYPELTLGNVYRVLGIEADSLRIISDAGEPILFNAKAFDFVDTTRPTTWISVRGDEGELYAYPPELRTRPSLFEAFFDYDKDARRRLHAYVHELCHAESAALPDPPNIYIRVEWSHDSADEPVTLYSELDEERWEVRKVEVFRDGRVTYADGKGSTGNTQLGDQPAPPNEEIAALGELEITEISRAEFDAAWDHALDADVREPR